MDLYCIDLGLGHFVSIIHFGLLLYISDFIKYTPFSLLKLNYLITFLFQTFFSPSHTPLFSTQTHSIFHSNNTFILFFITLLPLFHSLHSRSISYSSLLPLVLLCFISHSSIMIFSSSKTPMQYVVLPTTSLHVSFCLAPQHH